MVIESEIKINNKIICSKSPTYFIADIAANHDGDLERAKDLIYKCAESGADAAKFQHFRANTIVSDIGFKNLSRLSSHQSKWKKSVVETYEDASISLGWTQELKNTCKNAGIAFFTSPYEIDLVNHIDPYVEAHKIGSGDITWIEIIKHIASKKKPVILASGASSIDDVDRAVNTVLQSNNKLILLQCNTNYTASLENFKYINLNVLKLYAKRYPDVILGLSDHTPGNTTVLGAISLGAKVIEKHFTDDNSRKGPDHKFSMNPETWREMVDRSRELELSLGNGVKMIEDNEKETAIIQRRGIKSIKHLVKGTKLSRENLIMLRPCSDDSLRPFEINKIVGKLLKNDINKFDDIKLSDVE